MHSGTAPLHPNVRPDAPKFPGQLRVGGARPVPAVVAGARRRGRTFGVPFDGRAFINGVALKK